VKLAHLVGKARERGRRGNAGDEALLTFVDEIARLIDEFAELFGDARKAAIGEPDVASPALDGVDERREGNGGTTLIDRGIAIDAEEPPNGIDADAKIVARQVPVKAQGGAGFGPLSRHAELANALKQRERFFEVGDAKRGGAVAIGFMELELCEETLPCGAFFSKVAFGERTLSIAQPIHSPGSEPGGIRGSTLKGTNTDLDAKATAFEWVETYKEVQFALGFLASS